MTTIQAEAINRDGKTLRGIITLPDGIEKAPVVLHLHGFMGSRSGYRSSYTHMARALAQKGIGCARFDFYGNGESDGEFEEMTFTSLLENTEDLFNWLKLQPWADADRLGLSGQSMGGFVAASAAPKLNPKALVLQCPGAGMWYGCKERADAIVQSGQSWADVEGLRFDMSFNYDLAKYNPWQDAKGYDGSVIIIRGTNDKLVDDGACEQYVELYGDNCEFVHIEGGDHNFASIPARAACEEATANFLTKQL